MFNACAVIDANRCDSWMPIYVPSFALDKEPFARVSLGRFMAF